MKIKDLKEAQTWFRKIIKPHLTEAIKNKELHDAVISTDGVVILITADGQYFTIKLNAGQS